MKWRGAAIGGGATSGKLGPAVASRNKGGQYLRSRVVPSGAVPTPAQEVMRNALRSVVPTWSSGLSQSNRDAWNTYGQNVPTVDVLGDTIQLSGQNWFVGCNALRTQLGQAQVIKGPQIFDRGGVDYTGTTITLGGSTGTLTLGTAPADLGLVDGDVIALYGGRDFNPGRSKYFGSFQLTSLVAGDDTNSSFIFDLLFEHNTGNAMAFNLVVSRSDGRYTTPSRITVTP